MMLDPPSAKNARPCQRGGLPFQGVVTGDRPRHGLPREQAPPLTVGEVGLAGRKTFRPDTEVGEVRRASTASVSCRSSTARGAVAPSTARHSIRKRPTPPRRHVRQPRCRDGDPVNADRRRLRAPGPQPGAAPDGARRGRRHARAALLQPELRQLLRSLATPVLPGYRRLACRGDSRVRTTPSTAGSRHLPPANVIKVGPPRCPRTSTPQAPSDSGPAARRAALTERLATHPANHRAESEDSRDDPDPPPAAAHHRARAVPSRRCVGGSSRERRRPADARPPSDERTTGIRPDSDHGRPAWSAIRGRRIGSATRSSDDWIWVGSSMDPDRCCVLGANLRAAQGEQPLTTVPAAYIDRRSGGNLCLCSGWPAKPATRIRTLDIATTPSDSIRFPRRTDPVPRS
jgi:hypothetical protein